MIVLWSKKELELLNKMNITFDILSDLSDSQIENLYEIIPEHLMYYGFEENDEPNSVGLVCEDMITKLVKIMESRGLIG